MVGRVGRKNKEGKNIFYEPTSGIPPLTMLGKAPGHDVEILWELGSDPANPAQRGITPLSQLVFISKEGKTVPLPFRPGRWTPEKIKEILKEKDVAADVILAFGNKAEEDAEMRALTDALPPGGKEQEVPPIMHGTRIEGEMKAPISEQYLRAIAKVGFHYFLKYFPHFSGLEPEFDDIKQFIYHGTATRTIVHPVNEPFLKILQQPGARLNRW